MQSTERLDVHIGVIGGGPSGFAFAIEAQCFGWDVTVIDRGRSVPLLGEVLAAEAKYSLQRLGIYDEFVHEQRSLSGRRARWGTKALRESSTIFSPHGVDWLLDRQKFEARLRDRAASVGVHFRLDHAVNAHRESSSWTVKLRSGDLLKFDFLVDATGRPMWLTRRLGFAPVVIDHLVAVSLYSEGHDSPAYFEVESASEGWWYRAPLPNGRELLMLMTDRDLIPTDVLKSARLTCLGGSLDLSFDSIRPAHSALARSVIGPGWAAIGDAALAWDPLSGRGIKTALESAHLLAETLGRSNEGEETAAHAYAQVANETARQYVIARSNAYLSEQRWPSFPFWQRRHFSQEVSANV